MNATVNKISNQEAQAYSEVLSRSLTAIRTHCKDIPPDQLFDLTDALHNLPGFIISMKPWSSDEYNRMYLKPYDAKWHNGKTDILDLSLINVFKQHHNSIV
jgi:hypothetical protein